MNKRRFFTLLIVMILGGFVVYINNLDNIVFENNIFDYIIEDHFKDTLSKNIVSAIYLDYRVFDTLFEALLLIVAVIGTIHLSRHE